MRWARTLHTVDVHCAGEIGRVITGGVLNIPGSTMAEKLRHLNDIDRTLWRWLCSEPRSGPAGSFCLLLPSTRPDADVGLIVLQPDQAHAMSGSNAMCAVTAILETGTLQMLEPETVVVLDTAAGPVRAVATCADGKVTQVALDMPAAFVIERDVRVHTSDGLTVRADVCFGGVFYALVDVDQLRLTLAPENAREIATRGVALRESIATAIDLRHPVIEELMGLAYVMFHAEDVDGAIRTCTTMRPGRVDRSPCGTGSNAYMALAHAAGRARPGDRLTTRSIIGGEFVTEMLDETRVGSYPASLNRISGQCWIYGMSQIGLDPTDPFPLGFTLSDTWGKLDRSGKR